MKAKDFAKEAHTAVERYLIEREKLAKKNPGNLPADLPEEGWWLEFTVFVRAKHVPELRGGKA
jgi:hypothetical protein